MKTLYSTYVCEGTGIGIKGVFLGTVGQISNKRGTVESKGKIMKMRANLAGIIKKNLLL